MPALKCPHCAHSPLNVAAVRVPAPAVRAGNALPWPLIAMQCQDCYRVISVQADPTFHLDEIEGLLKKREAR